MGEGRGEEETGGVISPYTEEEGECD